MHVFVSPHPDDVVLSCGALVQSLTARGEAVAVLTLMAQDAPDAILHYDFIQRLHARWALGNRPFAQRRAEDQAALASLGVKTVRFGDWHDAIYRTDAAGHLLYATDDALFGQIQDADPLDGVRLDLLSTLAPVDVLYLPLGAGNHVDHQIVRDASFRSLPTGAEVWFYEEYPYSATSAEVYHSHGGSDERLFGEAAVRNACQQIDGALVPQTIAFTRPQLEAKINAITKYVSQLSSFWESVDAMRQSVTAYASAVGAVANAEFGERLWHLVNELLHESEDIV